MKHFLVTGGTGFIGSALVIALVRAGHRVRVFDDNSRGNMRRMKAVEGQYEFVGGDIRNPEAVSAATEGIDCVCHLAFVNGTEFFYTKPELVLDVGVKGMVNVLDACQKHKTPELIVASSSEVYQTPPTVPTDETAPLTIPDPLNPRYSYAAGKIISEIMTLNYGRNNFKRAVIFRPHNVYGPDMGFEHVIPQFVTRMVDACRAAGDSKTLDFPIQGSGLERRSFVFIDDFTAGLMCVVERGAHLNIYHIGTGDEITMGDLARATGEYFGKQVTPVPSALAAGGTLRRCPDITKLAALGYSPKVPLKEGLRITADWYVQAAREKAAGGK